MPLHCVSEDESWLIDGPPRHQLGLSMTRLILRSFERMEECV